MKNLTNSIVVSSLAAALFITGCGDAAKTVGSNEIKKAPVANAELAKTVATAKVITAKKVGADLSKIDGSSSLWNSAEFAPVMLYPQTTVATNDKEEMKLNKNANAVKAKVAALKDDKHLALAIIWEDKGENSNNGKCTDTYSDGVAVQFAKDVKDVNKLPYIGMGSKDREVAIYLKKVRYNTYEPHGTGEGTKRVETQVVPNQTVYFEKELQEYKQKVASLGSDNYERKFVSAGFRSLTEIKDDSAQSHMTMHRIKGYGWIATLVRPLKDDYANLGDTTPVAFAVWDGAKKNRDGSKLLSGWNAVVVGAQDKALVEALTVNVKGDINNGKAQAVANCASCHNFPGAQDRGYEISPFAGPDLSNIGGYATAAYIKESILEPSAVVVPGYNRNAHVNTPWYNIVDGKRISTMPGFDYLDEKTVTDIVAFMQTLKAPVAKESK